MFIFKVIIKVIKVRSRTIICSHGSLWYAWVIDAQDQKSKMTTLNQYHVDVITTLMNDAGVMVGFCQ